MKYETRCVDDGYHEDATHHTCPRTNVNSLSFNVVVLIFNDGTRSYVHYVVNKKRDIMNDITSNLKIDRELKLKTKPLL